MSDYDNEDSHRVSDVFVVSRDQRIRPDVQADALVPSPPVLAVYMVQVRVGGRR